MLNFLRYGKIVPALSVVIYEVRSNMQNLSFEEAIAMAKKFEQYGQFDMALKYYRSASEKQQDSKDAHVGAERCRLALKERIYYSTPANYSLVEGTLELRRGMLVFSGNNGKEFEHWLEHIENPRIRLGRILFDYDGKPIEGYSCSLAKRWIEILRLVLNGKYPECEGQNYSAVEKYILENFSEDTKEEAIKYFMDLSGCDYQDSSIVVWRILNSTC